MQKLIGCIATIVAVANEPLASLAMAQSHNEPTQIVTIALDADDTPAELKKFNTAIKEKPSIDTNLPKLLMPQQNLTTPSGVRTPKDRGKSSSFGINELRQWGTRFYRPSFPSFGLMNEPYLNDLSIHNNSDLPSLCSNLNI